MAENSALSKAKNEENDEFYTRYEDIQAEMNAYLEYNPNVFKDKIILCPCDDPEWSNFTKYFAQHFKEFGLKKLISTSYAMNSKKKKYGDGYQPSLFDYTMGSSFDESKEMSKGKIFTLTSNSNDIGNIDINDLKWNYLNGDGDFSSDEISKLRDEADIIVTNPPFSLFRDFMKWIVEVEKKFIILGNPNLMSKRDIFPLIKENKIWVGCKSMSTDSYFIIPEYYKKRLLMESKEGSGYKIIDGEIYGRTQAIWYTNVEHGRRHHPLSLMSMDDNIRFSKHKKSSTWKYAYKKFDNYEALEIPYVDSIPNDYSGIMAVPISFLDKYCPEQFEIIWRTGDIDWAFNECNFFSPPDEEKQVLYKKANKTWRIQNAYLLEDNQTKTFYDRIFIKYTDSWMKLQNKIFRIGE